MPNHTTPCPQMNGLRNQITKLSADLENHVAFDKQYQEETAKEVHEIRDMVNTHALTVGRLESRLKEIVHEIVNSIMTKHEAAEKDMYKDVGDKIDKLATQIEANRDARVGIELKALIWVIGIMASGIGALVFHILTEPK